MPRVYLVPDGAEVVRRRPLIAAGQVVEAWPDLYGSGQFWLDEESKALIDALGPPLPATLSLDATHVPIYYGPALSDIESLPREGSLRARVLSARGMAVAWITRDQFGDRNPHEPRSPDDPTFFLRRPRGASSHLWRLFRTRDEAILYMREFHARDPGALAWAVALPVGDYQALLARHATGS